MQITEQQYKPENQLCCKICTAYFNKSELQTKVIDVLEAYPICHDCIKDYKITKRKVLLLELLERARPGITIIGIMQNMGITESITYEKTYKSAYHDKDNRHYETVQHKTKTTYIDSLNGLVESKLVKRVSKKINQKGRPVTLFKLGEVFDE